MEPRYDRVPEAETEALVVIKGRHVYRFEYLPGQERELIAALVRQTLSPHTNLGFRDLYKVIQQVKALEAADCAFVLDFDPESAAP